MSARYGGELSMNAVWVAKCDRRVVYCVNECVLVCDFSLPTVIVEEYRDAHSKRDRIE